MNNLKNIRLKRGLTQEQLAQKIGRPHTYISKLENGVYSIENLSLRNAIKICDALRVRNPRSLVEE